MTAIPFTATVLGSPRIGPHRELKRAVEAYWAGRIDRAELEPSAARCAATTWRRRCVDAGLDSVPVNTFSFYDQVLDTAVLLGACRAGSPGIAGRPGPLLRDGPRHRRRSRRWR